jgi:uncharacterized protein
MRDDRSVLWRRIDAPGHEVARLSRAGTKRFLQGTAVFAHDGEPCRVDYAVVCDDRWRTRRVVVEGRVGRRSIATRIAADGAGRWTKYGDAVPAVDGCLDVDLSFTPATNSLPIRRLRLARGRPAAVRVAWVSFPELTLEPLDQVYRRLDAARVRYESNGGRFVRTLRVDSSGLVTSYPGLWVAEAVTAGGGASSRVPAPRAPRAARRPAPS